MAVPIPQWDARGVIPPINSDKATNLERSPYEVSLQDVITRFATSTDRINILMKFLDYRKQLHNIGLNKGFQWVDGSFVENKEQILGTSPSDIDVVTFYYIPLGETQYSLLSKCPAIFNPQQSKKQYLVDAYYVDMKSEAKYLIAKTTYWYSLWSHKRDGTWKGYIKIDLDPAQDIIAMQLLECLNTDGGVA